VACWLLEAAGAALNNVRRWGALALGHLPEDCQLWGAAVACLQSDLEQHLSRDSLEFRVGGSGWLEPSFRSGCLAGGTMMAAGMLGRLE
jgi:hypothetical protein